MYTYTHTFTVHMLHVHSFKKECSLKGLQEQQRLDVGPILTMVSAQLQHPMPLFALTVGLVVLAAMLCGMRRCLQSGITPQPRQTEGVKLGIYGILLTQTLNALATMVVLPTLPFFAMTLGATALEVSLMNSAYNLAQMFCSPLLGALSDRYGRKRVMLGGICIQMICNTFMVPRLWNKMFSGAVCSR